MDPPPRRRGLCRALRAWGLRALACSLPGAGAAWWLAGYSLAHLPLPPIAAACAALAVSGLAFALLFLPLAWWLAPSILEPVLRRLRRSP